MRRECSEVSYRGASNRCSKKNTTVRQTAKTFGVSKSTIHKDVTERLEEINPTLAKEVKMVLEKNKSERHIRGGMATKLKYEKETKKDVG